MTALYFAADADEANRLVTQAMTDLKLINLLDGLSSDQMDENLWRLTTRLITAYRVWLDEVISGGVLHSPSGADAAVVVSFHRLG